MQFSEFWNADRWNECSSHVLDDEISSYSTEIILNLFSYDLNYRKIFWLEKKTEKAWHKWNYALLNLS